MSKIALIKIRYNSSEEYYSKVKKFESALEEFTNNSIDNMIVGVYKGKEFWSGDLEYKVNLDDISPEQMEKLQKIKEFEIEYL